MMKFQRNLFFILALVAISLLALGCDSQYSLSSTCVPADGGQIIPSAGEYDKGARIDIQAIPANGFVFHHWEGDASGESQNVSVVLDENKGLIAVFRTLLPAEANLVDATISIGPGEYRQFPFSVDLDSFQDVKVQGSFQVIGGTGNDINACIFTRTDFVNWVNKQSVTALYYSGQVTIGDMDVDINASGEYVLVLENTFSSDTTKSVSAHIVLKGLG